MPIPRSIFSEDHMRSGGPAVVLVSGTTAGPNRPEAQKKGCSDGNPSSLKLLPKTPTPAPKYLQEAHRDPR